ncbi:DUF4397 domain-containing protein [Ferrimonas balearica]|uniref:DUF4397 domain-containing protein n=1 Tax=Ferrimonas balearica TaxID=44012 RepID=UPI001C9A0B98|nr:DUF4397 domain-containing protein [Ferrimonas balearica]MBY5920866.1 DUF4397 domain-containing protein [Ferrimonas balearica]MBY5996449.1 DUF4397 domain-containing protein [Ferrimonas balearica]
MKRIAQVLLLGCSVAFLAACDDDDDDLVIIPPPVIPLEVTDIRVLHASPDAPMVNITVNGDNALEMVDYQEGSGFIELFEGEYSIGVDALLPSGDTATVIGPATLDLMGDMEYSVIAVGKVADETLEPLILTRPDEDFGAGNIRLQVVHASPDAPEVDVYLTEPDADISMMDPALASVPFKGYSDLIEVASGDYQARVTLAGSKEVVFDSGALTLAAETDLMLVAVTNTLSGPSPINVMAWSDDGVSLISDVNAGAEVRVVHASPDAPEVNVLVDDTVALSDVPFPAFSGFLPLSAGTHNLKVEPSAAPGTYVIDADADFALNTAYTVLATGFVAEITPWIVEGKGRRIATAAQLRLLHASPSAGNVDIYVGTDNDISDEEPAFSDVPIRAETGLVALPPGDYVVTVTATGTKDAAIGPLALTLEGNKIYTAIARDTAGGGGPLGLILLDDFNM